MKMHKTVLSAFAFLALSSLAALGPACEGGHEDELIDNSAALAACGLDDGSVDKDAALRACDPGDTKKTTICHIPPGNPANAHTLCIGNAAVSHHLKNHGDLLGPCEVEEPCQPPGTGGSTGTGGAATGGAPATGGAATGGVPATGGAPATGGVPIVG